MNWYEHEQESKQFSQKYFLTPTAVVTLLYQLISMKTNFFFSLIAYHQKVSIFYIHKPESRFCNEGISLFSESDYPPKKKKKKKNTFPQKAKRSDHLQKEFL